MSRNLSCLTLIFLIAQAACVHLRHQQAQQPYDKELYYQKLNELQTQLKQDLLAIQQMYQQLDTNIKDASQDPKQQLSLLQEGLADERDSIYSIEQYLNLPYNLRSCQCFNFTDELKSQLEASIQKVQQSILDIQSKTKECADCAMVIEIKNEIAQQKNYLQIMKDTLESKCCHVYNTVYLDNLNATNWQYGNLTPQSYKEQMQELKDSYSPNDTIFRPCPISKPYSDQNYTSCKFCQDASLIFNLETRECEQCPVGKIFNYQTRTCDFNVTCPAGTKFNEQTVMCEVVHPSINDSMCPPETPIWNPQVYGCFKCENQKPYFDENLHACTECPVDTTYDPQSASCVHKNCRPGETYNATTGQCQIGQPSSNVSTSNCPPDRPYWNQNSYSCGQCPPETPFYNETARSCQICPANSTYDSSNNRCSLSCPAGQILNQSTMKCQDKPVNPPGENVGICPPDRPIWDEESKSCGKCSSAAPFWNEATGKCQRCQEGQEWDESSQSCKNVNSTITCPEGERFNESSQRCELANGNGSFGICPPDLPYYSQENLVCQQCPSDKPYFHPDTKDCHELPPTNPPPNCPDGQHLDQSNKCVDNNSTGGGHIAQCPPDLPHWNSNTLKCEACQDGLVFDPSTEKCVDKLPPVVGQCGYNQQWIESEGACKTCEDYQKYDESTKTCQDYCRPGEVYDDNYQRCLGTISRCPVGLEFIAAELRCVCPEGANYRYVPEDEACEEYCESGSQYDYLTHSCISGN